MEPRDELGQVLRDLLESNRAVIEEVRAVRAHFDYSRQEMERWRRRVPWLFASMLGVTLLFLVGLIGGTYWANGTSENQWDRQVRQQQEQFDRIDRSIEWTEKLVGRTESLIGRWEKATPKE
jgi:hypothetical protein